ncbi:hypothetical protein ACFU96_37320 [Streptomyces sp. NPDC057620]|uniref:hypothetical protein n=1 Tax=Streptomyces sp. NPDC057620 TaxID=3346185 RepID=UPI0036A69F74
MGSVEDTGEAGRQAMWINSRAEETEPQPSFRKRIFRKLIIVTASTLLQSWITGILFGRSCDSGAMPGVILLVLLFAYATRAE